MEYSRSLILFVLTITFPCSLRADECRCPGKELTQHNSYGNAEKIGWKYSVSIVKEGSSNSNSPSLMCFKRSVINKSNDSALSNIRWDVASFRRRWIPAHFTSDSCSTVPGILSHAPSNGPLYYGVSSGSIETTVRPPEKGWQQQEAQIEPQWDEFPPIRSVFELALNEAGAEATITVYSYVTTQTGSPKVRLTYEIENQGPQDIGFVLNLPTSGAMGGLGFLKGAILRSNTRMHYDAYVESRVTAQTAVIRIAHAKENLGLAAETVGIYAPVDGKRLFSDKALLESVP